MTGNVSIIRYANCRVRPSFIPTVEKKGLWLRGGLRTTEAQIENETLQNDRRREFLVGFFRNSVGGEPSLRKGIS
ncbi:hypothetical protein PIB30_038788 [Stylosanthes scabra]|uniref:Uncharacterized protein n=1 Tax=Stylosanthes scabra TaxID=79078 RepID=A0ABU6YBH2_9FABA|nr:hypothetical protein [Stylosanthes scabra]